MRRLFYFIVPMLLLAGCGGGSDGGGPSFVGTYIGTGEFTLSGAGQTISQDNLGIQFDISPDGVVRVSDPGQPPYAEGPLTGNTFIIIAAGSVLNTPGVSCTGTFTFNGTISGNTMTGTVSSNNLTCNGIPFTVTGSFTATLQPQGQARIGVPGTGLLQILKDAIR